jgi:hypothetical protein
VSTSSWCLKWLASLFFLSKRMEKYKSTMSLHHSQSFTIAFVKILISHRPGSVFYKHPSKKIFRLFYRYWWTCWSSMFKLSFYKILNNLPLEQVIKKVLNKYWNHTPVKSRILFGHKICMSRCFPQITITATYINVKFVVMQLPSYSSCVHIVWPKLYYRQVSFCMT